ncbi:MAG: hypothetical protein EPO21_06670 [Chloroflexota bacterium]|nr:MAG: hypothetical protein EPO21_06670 [Chloroflexota bacterium]
MGKKKQKVAPVRQMSKHQLSRWEREKRLQRLLYTVGGALGVVLVAVLGFGFFREFVQPPSQVVAQVNDRSFNMDYYVKLYSLRDYMLTLQQSFMQQSQAAASGDAQSSLQQQLQQIQFARALLPQQVLDGMIDDEIIRQGAQSEDVAVTPQEVDDYLVSQFVAPPQEGEEVDPAKQRADFEQTYNSILSAAGIPDAQYREVATAELLKKKLEQKLQDAVPTRGEQVRVQSIQASTEDEANAVKAKLDQGITFDQAAQQVAQELDKNNPPNPSPSPSADASASPSEHTSPTPPPTPPSPSFSDPGWIPRGLLDAKLDEAVFALQPGQVSEAIQQSAGSYVFIKLIERQADRDISADQQSQLKAQVFQIWLDNQQKTAKVERKLDSQKQDWATRQVQKMRTKLGRAAG